jgi:two-component system cell cycle sensor histidine kinase/response regulator CckA
MPGPRRSFTPLQLALSYSLFAGLWIIGSDWLMGRNSTGIDGSGTALNIVKGLGFVVVTAALLYAWARSFARRLAEREAEAVAARDGSERAQHLHSALSAANRAVLESRDRETLCRTICQLVVDRGGLRLAWIGFLPAAEGCLRPAVWAGPAEDYLRDLSIQLRPDSPRPAARALSAASCVIVPEIEHEPGMASFRERARRQGLRSHAALPFRVDGQPAGVLCVYASEPGFFGPGTLPVLEELAADIGHGLEFIAGRAARAAAERALRESEERWQFALEGAGDGVWDWDVATNRVFFSPRWKSMLGYEDHEIGSSLEEWKSRVHPDDLAATLAAIEDHFSGRAPVYVGEYRLRCKDGSWCWILDRGKIVSRAADGRPQRVIGTHTDISARKEAERSLREQEEMFRTVFLSAHDAMLVLDEAGAIVDANPEAERLFGRPHQQLLGTFPWTHSPAQQADGGDSTAAARARIAEALAGETPRFEWRHRRADGAIAETEVRLSPFRVRGRALLTAMIRDVTDRKAHERRALRAQRLESLGALSGGIAHDLNNVLTPIMLSVELLRLECPQLEAQPLIDTLATSARRGADIVKQILTFARGAGGERVPVNSGNLVREIGALARETFPRNIEVHTHVGAGLPPVLGDSTQLHQVLLNLAVNARDAMPHGGSLTLRVERRPADATGTGPGVVSTATRVSAPDGLVQFAVTDTGTGMTPEVQDRLFEPFFTTKPRDQGTGLGLATAHGIVRSHGGFIEVTTAVGRGTEFRVCLPAVAAGGMVESLPAAGPELRGEGRRVLLVEDETAVRTVTAAILRRCGFVVESAVDGLDGLERYRAAGGDFALVVTDVMMPRLDGAQLAVQLHAENPDLPILAVSGLLPAAASDGDRLPPGFTALLRKPYNEAALLEAVGRVLAPESAARGGR